jgi:hypothetical protein
MELSEEINQALLISHFYKQITFNVINCRKLQLSVLNILNAACKAMHPSIYCQDCMVQTVIKITKQNHRPSIRKHRCTLALANKF